MLNIKSTIVNALPSTDSDPSGPESDVHEDESAEVGDLRVQVVPLGEIFSYDDSFASGKIYVGRQRYKKTATYRNGSEHYGWFSDRKVFVGTPEEWRSVADNPESKYDDIPAQWDTIVAHVNSFLDMHEDQLNSKEYPNSVKNL